MGRFIALVAALIAALASLAWVAWAVVRVSAVEGFDRDLTARSELAVTSARYSLGDAWGSPDALRAILGDLVRDERLIGAQACRVDGLALVARTPGVPDATSCERVGPKVRPLTDAANDWGTWSASINAPGGAVHVTATPVRSNDRVLGFVVLVRDFSYSARRESRMQRLLVIAFGALAVAAAMATAIAGQIAWWRWNRELRRSLERGTSSPAFRFILRDVRALAERIAAERDIDRDIEAWTPRRLREALHRHAKSDEIIVVANREPYIHEKTNGGVQVVHPASGLVTALEPVLRACSGVWIGHGSGSADRETADSKAHVAVPPDDASYTLRRIWLSQAEEQGYYYGFSNEGLWPLCHTGHTRPIFRTEDWHQYQVVNRRFADATREEASADSPIILVQDYHFMTLPQLIRERLPRATITMFWHIPWPNPERFGICPQREALLEGMLGANVLGFHTQSHCNNFIETVERYLETRTDKELGAIVHQGHQTFVRPYPISLEWPPRQLAGAPHASHARAEVFAELGLPDTALLGVGVDRLDYTKGIEERLLSVERMLERFPQFQGRFSFAQLAAPSRTAIERYQQLNADVEALTDRINARFGNGGYRPIILKRAHHDAATVYRYYRAADLCYVSSLHDGMNLVAKEFVAARDDEGGVLVLSQFTGAASELTEALIVNPYDLEQASGALAAALVMPADEQHARIRHMRAQIAEFNIYRWAGRILLDAARLRRHDQLWSQLSARTKA
jgi:trehalose 6-phosphate synthase